MKTILVFFSRNNYNRIFILFCCAVHTRNMLLQDIALGMAGLISGITPIYLTTKS
jgi:hypothetical protein